MAEFGQRYYQEDEAEQILRLAASMSASEGAMTHDRLLATAAELGIPAEAVVAAQKQVAAQKAEAQARAEFDELQRREFFSHAGTWLSVVAGLVIATGFLHWRIYWVAWPLGIWGITIATDVSETFFRKGAAYNDAYAKWQRKRAKKQAAVTQEAPDVEDQGRLLDRYVQGRLGHGHDISKADAMRYLREKTSLSKPEAQEAVELYVGRNPGLLD